MNIYKSRHYKLLLLVPIAVLFLSIYFSTQVEYGIDLKGGVLITASTEQIVNADELTQKLTSNFELEELEVRQISGGTTGVYIEFKGEKTLLEAAKMIESKDYESVIELSKKFTGEMTVPGEVKDQADIYFSKARENFKNQLTTLLITELKIPSASISVQDIGPSLGEFFLSQARNALILAFIFIAILVFYYFRNVVVSFAVFQSALFDVLLGYAVLGMFKIPLSLVTFAPLLMLIGYSIDTDIMLTDRMIKRKTGTPIERLNGAMKTGLTMTLTAIFTMVSLMAVSYYANITVLFHISLIIFIGLLGDLVATWFTNAVIILWHLERKTVKK